MENIKQGDLVHVDFMSESATAFSGQRFTGDGRLDLVEEGYAYGRLNDGRPFMCPVEDVEPREPKWTTIRVVCVKCGHYLAGCYCKH